MRGLIAVMVVLGLAGCGEVEASEQVDCFTHSGPAAEDFEGTHDALRYVWRDTYGGNTAELPAFHWVAGDYFQRADDPSENLRGTFCRADGQESIWVAWRDGVPSNTALAHELTHAHLLKDQGDADPEHTLPEWSLLPSINAELREVGL